MGAMNIRAVCARLRAALLDAVQLICALAFAPVDLVTVAPRVTVHGSRARCEDSQAGEVGDDKALEAHGAGAYDGDVDLDDGPQA